MAEKAGKSEVRLKTVKVEPEDWSERAIALATGQGTVNLLTIPQNGSVTPIKNASTFVPVIKNMSDYNSASISTTLYIPNTPLKKGVVNIVRKFPVATLHIFLLEKDTASTSFTVKDKITQVTVNGENTILTNFTADGNGNEYIGVLGGAYFKSTGGTGF